MNIMVFLKKFTQHFTYQANMYGKKGDDPVSKLFLSLWEISCLMFMKTRLTIFWKNIFLLSELKTVSSFYIKFKVCVCVIIRAKMLYIIPDSGI